MKQEKKVEVLVVGGGQAGLAMSYCLKKARIDHLVLEKQETGNSWRNQRWDSFHLVTQNWQNRLPGFGYQGNEPEGFLSKNQLVQYLEDYQFRFSLPVEAHTEVFSVSRDRSNGFSLVTTQGVFQADAVVIATGSFHHPWIPELRTDIPLEILQLHSSEYRSPQALPGGASLVVGGGQSGVQIASEIHSSGREVFLSIERSPSIPRRYRGQDIMHWITSLGLIDLPLSKFPGGKQMRHAPSPVISEKWGDIRKLGVSGVCLAGRFQSVKKSKLIFGNNIANALADSEMFYLQLIRLIDSFIERKKIIAPVEQEKLFKPLSPVPRPFTTMIDLKKTSLSSIIWATGFKNSYSWINLPVFDDAGFPSFQRGITAMPGFYFLGLHWLYNLKSGSLFGVGEDAEYLCRHILGRLPAQRHPFRRSIDVEKSGNRMSG